MEKPIIIIGANTLGRAALEIFKSNDILVFGFLDDNEALHNTEIDEVSVLGFSDEESLVSHIGDSCEVFIASDETEIRKNLVESLTEENKTMPSNAIHKHSLISESSTMGHGNFLNANVTLGANSELGNHCILQTGSIIDSSAKVGDFVQLGQGAIVANDATIEDEVFIGTGAVIVAGIKVGKGARIGAGSVVVANVKAGETVFGNPAKKIG